MAGRKKGGAGEAPAKSQEERKAERRARFLRMVDKRVDGAIKRLQLVARLGNRSGYEYTLSEAAQIIGAIKTAVDRVAEAFNETAKSRVTFTLQTSDGAGL